MSDRDSILLTLSSVQIANFWAKVEKRGVDDCWLWTGGSKTRSGYGQYAFRSKGIRRSFYAHRMAKILSTSCLLPNRYCACHHCDNPSCCNPAHIFVGTYKDNSVDAVNKKRVAHGDNHYSRRCPEKAAKGEKHGMAKLSAADVSQIRSADVSRHGSKKDLAEKYGISRTQIAAIIKRRTWKHHA